MARLGPGRADRRARRFRAGRPRARGRPRAQPLRRDRRLHRLQRRLLPLYLGSCALGPGIRPAFEVADPYDLAIELAIERGGAEVWHGATSTAQLHRRFEELAEYLFRADRHPDGAVLSTGTCLVPQAPFSLEQGDTVHVRVEGVGTLTNPVVRGLPALEDGASPELSAALGLAPASAGTGAGS